MSIGEVSVGEGSLAGQAAASTSTKKPPPKRQMVAKADLVLQPEAR